MGCVQFVIKLGIPNKQFKQIKQIKLGIPNKQFKQFIQIKQIKQIKNWLSGQRQRSLHYWY
jgi:hypothetical protein